MEHDELVKLLAETLKNVKLTDGSTPEVTVGKHDEASKTDILKFKVPDAVEWVTIYRQKPKA